MKDPVVIGLPPDRSNIKLIVEPCPDLHKLHEVLSTELLEKHTAEFCKDNTNLRLIITSTAFGLRID